jgi:hypothetical protein
MAAVENQLAFGNEFNDSGRFVNDQRTLLTFGTTPGGTFYATTPRGTRITYDRDFLITFQNSPLARSAPKNLPVIPGVTVAPENKNTANKATSPKTGSRIKYDRDFLLSCQKSPLAAVKPQNLPNIPGLVRVDAATKDSVNGSKPTAQTARADSTEDAQFHLEM